jgi:hypothetical protein
MCRQSATGGFPDGMRISVTKGFVAARKTFEYGKSSIAYQRGRIAKGFCHTRPIGNEPMWR